jgi:hypothetical protein
MRSGSGKAVRVAGAGAILLALAGCDGDSSTTPPLVVVTPAPVRGVLYQGSYPHENDAWIQLPVLVSQRGVLDITVDWTYPDTWMYIYFGRTECNYAQLVEKECPFMLSSETKDPKPRVLYTETLDTATYYLVLYNVPRDVRTGKGSDRTESVAVQLGLTVSASGQRSPDAVRLGRPTVVPPPHL